MRSHIKYALKPELVKNLNAAKAWPKHKELHLFIPRNGAGMKAQSYSDIRKGGAGSKTDISHLLMMFTEQKFPPFIEVLNKFLSTMRSDSKNITLTQLFDATTTAIHPIDYMETGGLILLEKLAGATIWKDPTAYVNGISSDNDLHQISEWIRTTSGRELSGNASLSTVEALRFDSQYWGPEAPDFEQQFQRWTSAFPWTVVYSGNRTPNKEEFVNTGANIALPLNESCYKDIASGKRHFCDIACEDLTVPAFGVYLYATSEAPDMVSEAASYNSVTALMYQIAALSSFGRVRALAPAPIPVSSRRLKQAGFQQVGTCSASQRDVPLWESISRMDHQFILNAMRCALMEHGFMNRPPYH